MSTSSTDVALSVVVGSNGAPGSVDRFLEALAPQIDADVEVIVCEPTRARTAFVCVSSRPVPRAAGSARARAVARRHRRGARGRRAADDLADASRRPTGSRPRSGSRPRRTPSAARSIRRGPAAARLGRVLLPLRARHAAVRGARVPRPSRRQRRLPTGSCSSAVRDVLSRRILGAGRAPRAACAGPSAAPRPAARRAARAIGRDRCVRCASAPPWPTLRKSTRRAFRLGAQHRGGYSLRRSSRS